MGAGEVGNAVVGTGVVGDEVVGAGVVGDAVIGEGVVGDAVIGAGELSSQPLNENISASPNSPPDLCRISPWPRIHSTS